MAKQALVQIIGTPVACAEGVKEGWRETADWAARKLAERYGDRVKVEYFDLFDPCCPAFSGEAQIPVVLVNSKCVSSGGKISIPTIRKCLEIVGIETQT